jgi:soluble lytic murein transglycosylase-like protein
MAITVAANADQQQQHDPELRAILKKTINDSDSFVDRFDAEVWLVDMSGRLSRKIPNGNKRLTLLKLIHREASRAGLEPELVLALIQVESNFDRFAISRVGAQGLMQVMPFWKNEIGRPQDNLTKNSVNLKYGCTILKHYIDIEHGNLTRALARYNGSLGKLRYPEKVLDIWQKYWFVNNN